MKADKRIKEKMSSEQRKTVFYGRRATIEQSDVRSGRDQIKVANNYLKKIGLPSIGNRDAYFDVGSRPNLYRPALSRLMDHVKEGKIRAIVVLSMDRFGRNIKDVLKLIDVFIAHDVSIHSADWSINTSSRTGKTLFSCLRIFSEYENLIRKERCSRERLCSVESKRGRGRRQS